MNPQNRKLFLIATAIVEVLTGLCLIFLPAAVFSGLLGVDNPAVESIFIGRLGGAALLAIGVASWLARTDTLTPAQFGLLTGLLIYNAAAAILIASAGVVLKMSGVALRPAAVLHAILTVWCISCLRRDRIAS
jgi:hypothetical protein